MPFSTYATYALAMRAAAWDAALRPVNRLHGRYEAATTDDPALTKSYAKLEAFFGAREESAARGAATRKKNTSSKKPRPRSERRERDVQYATLTRVHARLNQGA